jgi:hypothetical protein
MKIYNYTAITNEFISETIAEESPLDPGVFLIPANATEIEPPTVAQYEIAVFTDGVWIVKDDWRGVELYSTVDGTPIIINEIGIAPTNHTTIPRPDNTYIWSVDAWVLDLDVYKSAKLRTLELDRNKVIQQPISSSVLGTENTYSATLVNRQFLNDLVTLNAGGMFTCIDSTGSKVRVNHTAEQLLQLAKDFQVKISKDFDNFYATVDLITNATTKEQIDAI